MPSAALRRWLRGEGSLRQTLSNVGVGALFVATQLAMRGVSIGAFAVVADRVPWKLGDGALAWVLAFFALDFVYYVQHRLEHGVPLLWAVHAVHHQSRDYNLSVSFRVGMLAALTTASFHTSLALLGVSLPQYVTVLGVHAVLLFGLHARTRFAFGPGRVFNAPVLHRVHHGMDAWHIDKNFGGVLLVFDHLFGSYAPPTVEPRCGIAGEAAPLQPLAANLAPWQQLAARMRAQPRWTGKLRALLVHDGAPPRSVR